MKKLIFLNLVLFGISSCKKEDRYTIVPQSATFSYTEIAPEPYALNYTLSLKSIPYFVSFGKPVAYPDGRYEALVLTPYEINSGLVELYIYDSVGAVVEKYKVNIPLPNAGSKDEVKILSLVGQRYNADLNIKYTKIK